MGIIFKMSEERRVQEKFTIDYADRRIKLVAGMRRRYHQEDGKLDEILKRKWNEAMEAGAFLHPVDGQVRHFEGKRGWVGVFSPVRASKKRSTPNFKTVIQKFQEEKFNFSKVKDAERLFEIEYKGKKYEMIINNSPYSFGHCLLVPEPTAGFAQLLTRDAMETAIETMFQSNAVGFRMMFNSICGCGSVNHLHFQCYYNDYRIPSEDIECDPITSCVSKSNSGRQIEEKLYVIKQTFPVRGFIVEASDRNLEQVAEFVATLTDKWAKANMAHNVALIRGKHLHHEIDNDEFVLRVYIWPRRPTLGERNFKDFHCAVTELIGDCYFGTEQQHKNWIADDIVQTLSAYDIGEEFERVTGETMALFTSIFSK